MSPPRIFGLVGFPVKHSFSAVMHNAAFMALGVKARYKLFEKAPGEFSGFIRSIPELGIAGLNVTVPYKEKVIVYLKSISSAAREIGAVNTVVVAKDGKLKGYNTDYLGFARHLKELRLRPKRAAIIGAGGASRAVIFALLKLGAEEIFIYDIDKYKPLALVNRFSSLAQECRIISVANIDELRIKDRDLLVNASTVGMRHTDPCLVGAQALNKNTFVYDLIYNPPKTKLLALAEKSGLPHANGLGMLLYQGIEAFNIWLKPKNAPIEVMRRALKEALRK